MSSLPCVDTPRQPISSADAKIWRDRWRQASEVDRQLRAERIQNILWERDWTWIDGLLRIGVQFAEPRRPNSLMEYRRRIEEKLPR